MWTHVHKTHNVSHMAALRYISEAESEVKKQLSYLHAITSMQTNCLVWMEEITEVRQSPLEARALLDIW